MKSIVSFLAKSLATLFVGAFGVSPMVAGLLFSLAFVDDRLPPPVLGIAQWMFDDPFGIIISWLLFFVIQGLVFGAGFWLVTEKIWSEKIKVNKNP